MDGKTKREALPSRYFKTHFRFSPNPRTRGHSRCKDEKREEHGGRREMKELDPNEVTVREFVEKLNGRGFKATPNREIIQIGEFENWEELEVKK